MLRLGVHTVEADLEAICLDHTSSGDGVPGADALATYGVQVRQGRSMALPSGSLVRTGVAPNRPTISNGCEPTLQS